MTNFINFWTVLGTIFLLGIVSMFVPFIPQRPRRTKPSDGLRMTPEIEKARKNEKKRVEELKKGRG